MKRYLLYILGVIVLLGGCRHEDFADIEAISNDKTGTKSVNGMSGKGLPGIAYIKVQNTLQSEMLKSSGGGTISLSNIPTGISATLKSINANSIQRLFFPDPRFEKRKQREGLDRWYIVTFEKDLNLDQTIATLSSNSQMEIVEKVYESAIPIQKATFDVPIPFGKKSSEVMPFNDPDLNKQWHYRNFGTLPRSVAGADINLFEAWKTSTGTPNVIVSVVDGGIDVTHEDLVDNLWINKGEIPGNGIDDDGNGFVDDIHGYNFVSYKGDITLDDVGHGTHVGGTVAARNNNGIGVGGVAGGNGSPDSGVRLMSCQIFEGANGGNSASATVYGADNGAVVSQNSWGYRYPGPAEIPASIRDAINYFIKYAGCDNDGNQLPNSPMKGGVVIYAAGNDDMEFNSYPASYPPVIAVSAMAPNWKKAWYSNWGVWVDIMAPGGDQYFSNGMVYSSLPPSLYNGKKYGFMQGTSMACPHVSGIAALIVSKFGRQGFTNKDLEVRILNSLRPENIDIQNPKYEEKLGVGYIDAALVFAENKNKNPDVVSDLTADADYTSLTLKWTTVADADDGTAIRYHIHLSNTPLTAENYKSTTPFVVKSTGLSAGEATTYKVSKLKDNTTYYAAIIAIDRWGLESNFTAGEFKTLTNDPPVIGGLPQETIRVSGSDVQRFTVALSDPNGHALSYKIKGESRGVSVLYKDGVLNFTIRAIAPVGSHEIELEITDELGAKTTSKIPFEVFIYQPPVISKKIPNMILGMDQKSLEIDINQFITYQPTQNLSIEVSSSDNTIASGTVSGTTLSVKGNKTGESTISVSLSDGKESVKAKFQVRVVANSTDMVYMIYPVPATKTLNVLVNPQIKQANFTIRSVAGEKVFSKDATIAEASPVTLYIQELTAGVYTLVVDSDKGNFKKTFVKQ